MAAKDIIRKKIRDAMETRMQLIRTTGGYYSNIGANVTIKKTNPYGPNTVDGINICDESEDQTLDAEDESLEKRTIHFILFIALKQSDPDKVLEAIADVEKIIKNNKTWDGEALNTIPRGNEDEVDQEEYIFRGVKVHIDVEYTTEAFKAED